jgi:carbon monoxide dehydrogenase subunit G
MRIAGSHTINAPREDVWKALHDPAVLARTLPGCESLEVVGPDRYAATLNAGVASIKGTYQGEVELGEKSEPERYTMRASGAGAPGTVRADATVHLHDEGETTRVEYDADAVVGGMIGGVGQRMIVGVAKKTAGEFFTAVERDIVEGPVAVVPAAGEAVTAPTGAPATGQVFAGRAAAPSGPSDDALKYLIGAVVGAALVLLGVLAGRRSTR